MEEIKCVYILRYLNWPRKQWKIGCTQNIDKRLSPYKTANGCLPDIVIIKETIDYRLLEKITHRYLKEHKQKNTAEHFILNDFQIVELIRENEMQLYKGSLYQIFEKYGDLKTDSKYLIPKILNDNFIECKGEYVRIYDVVNLFKEYSIDKTKDEIIEIIVNMFEDVKYLKDSKTKCGRVTTSFKGLLQIDYTDCSSDN